MNKPNFLNRIVKFCSHFFEEKEFIFFKDIKSILKSSLSFVWKYKFLWFFGLFLSIVAVGSEFDYLSNIFSKLSNGEYFFKINFLSVETQNFASLQIGNIFSWNQSDRLSNFFIILVFSIIFPLAIFLGIVSQTGLILAFKKKFLAKEKISFGELFKLTKEYFWNILKIGVSRELISLIFWLILFFFLIKFEPNFILYFISFFIYLPLTIILAFVSHYIFRYLILDNEKFKPALKKGIQLFFSNWLKSLIMGFLLLILTSIFGIIFFLFILILIAFPFLLIIFLFALISGVDLSVLLLGLKAIFAGNPLVIYFFFTSINLGITILTNIAAILIMFSLIIFGGIMTAFREIAWSHFFLKIKK